MQLRSWALAPEVVVTKATRKRDGEFRRGAPRVKPRHSFRVFGTTVKPALNLPGGRTLPLTLPSEIGLVGNWEMYFHSLETRSLVTAPVVTAVTDGRVTNGP